MKFHISASHVKRQNRKAIYLILFFTVLIAGFIAKLVSSKSIEGMTFPVIGIIIFAPTIFRTYKRIKEGADAYPVIELDELTGKIAVSYKDVIVTVDVTQIKNLRLQYKSEHLESVIVKTSSGEVMRFEGYENLDTLASNLVRFTPAENITNAKLYHR